jgi:lipopolysaccharide/colanic/teichoic acid biosynthesis glycosyltransferase
MPAELALHRGRAWYDVVKPIVDRVLALAGLIALAPVLLVIALAVRLDSPGPIIFRQTRLGRHGKPFTMFKFRTMWANADDGPHREAYERFRLARSLADSDAGTFKLLNDPRVTRVGRFLRATSLDELPQLVNVLLGEMSLVGPRPPIPYEAQHYEPRHWNRLSIKPGLTGPWQATARSRVGFEEMVDMDLDYVANCGLWRDLKILARTVVAVLSRDGAG